MARFNATTGMREAATYLIQGTPNDITIDPAGNAWVAGWTAAHLLSADCSRLLFSTPFGSSDGNDLINSLCLAPNGDVLLFGQTKSETDFPVLNAFQPQFNGGEGDTFVARISMGAVLKMSRSGQTVILSWPIGATNFVLEATTSLSTVSWTTVTNTPTVSANERSVQLPLTGNTEFFRLRRP